MITITLIIPMYNEAARIGKCLRALRAYKPLRGATIDRVIFVDDGSTDRTVSKVKRATIPYPKTILAYPENHGRGYALKLAMKEATGDYAIWLDADMSTPLSQIDRFLPTMNKGVPVIIGSRKIKGAVTPVKQPLYRIILGHGFSKLSGIILGVPVGDFTCGFKAFSRRAYKTIFPLTQIERWGNDSETLFLAKKFNMNIAELPVLWNDDPRTKVKLVRDMYMSFAELFTIRWLDFSGAYEQHLILDSTQLAYETIP